MIHLPALIHDLGFILITAAVVSVLFKKMKQPVVLGYLIAGFFLGPHFPFFHTVVATESIKVWAEIGVIFLLFGLGLEFSFKKLAQVGMSASITAVAEIVFMLGAGYVTGQLLRWSKMDSLFLGGILSISSTTIIVRAFEELGLKGKSFVSLVLGVLIVEDLIAILLLVLLSSMALTQSLSGSELAASSLRLIFFLVLWFILGIYLLPIFLKKIRPYLSNETMLLVAVGLCLMMVITSTGTGFSPELGAFVMGSLLAETREGHRIELLLLPVRDLFAAIFFVSVGMMIDPKILQQYFGIIMLLTAITVVGKFISSSLGALISGKNLKTSVQTGMSLAQIGEFSFIIATLGVTLKVTSDFLYPIAVAVSAITTFITPYLIKYSDHFYTFFDQHLPQGFKNKLARYEAALSSSASENAWQLAWRSYGMKVILNAVLVLGITWAMSRFVFPTLQSYFPDRSLLDESISVIVCFVTLIFCAPFLWAMIISPPAKAITDHPHNVTLLKRLQLGVFAVRLVIGVGVVILVISQFASITALAGFILVAVIISGIFFGRFIEPLYRTFEKRFIANLSDKEKAALEAKPLRPELAPWDATLTELIVSPQSEVVACSLEDLKLREKWGVTVAMIERGSEKLVAPQRSTLLLPYDKVFIIGTEEQLAAVKERIETTTRNEPSEIAPAFGLGSVSLRNDDPFTNKTIRECGIRELLGGLVVGLERQGERILNPDLSLQLLEGDLVWVVGDLERLRTFKKHK